MSFTLTSVSSAADPAVDCGAAKMKEAGKYANCRLKADSKALKKNETPDYSRCSSKFADKWSKAEAKAAGACPSNGDEATVEAAITTCMGDVATGVAPPPACAGVSIGGACWFLTAQGDDCDTTCAAAGLLYDEATRTYVGSDGTNANCETVMDALGAEGSGAPVDINSCDNGYGCVTEFGDRARCTDPVTDSIAIASSLYRICACSP